MGERQRMMHASGLIAILTDFGSRDAYVGVMKGVIYTLYPAARIVDLTHEVQPQNVREGAFLLAAAWPYFPDGTVFLAVVDPGVGTERRMLAARCGRHYFVGPDNGLLTLVWRQAAEREERCQAVALTEPRWWWPGRTPSRTFHGRDIFAPVAAHLARGVELEAFGPPVTDPVLLEFPEPRRSADTALEGEILHVDRFGNCISNLTEADVRALGDLNHVAVKAAGMVIQIREAYGEVEPGQTLALFNSEGFLEIAVREGSAARRLGLKVGDPVKVWRMGSHHWDRAPRCAVRRRSAPAPEATEEA